MSLDKLIEQFFAPKPASAFGLDDILKIITEESIKIGPPQALREAKKEKEVDLTEFLPTIKITEDWGKPESKDRQIIEAFTSNIEGGTLEEKLASLNRIIEGANEEAGISEILATLVVIEILSALLAEFTESAGGFIFEAFLAGLFGDKSVQIVDVDKSDDASGGAVGKPITDVRLGDKEYSLKLLGPSTDVKGSFFNMVEHFKSHDHVIYLDARRLSAKGSDGLEFGEFTITLQDFVKVFVDPFLKEVNIKEPVKTDSAEEAQKIVKRLWDGGTPLKKLTVGKKGFVPGSTATSWHYSPSAVNEVRASGEMLNQLSRRIVESDPEELQEYAPFTFVYSETKFEGTKAEKLFGSFAVVQQLQTAIDSGDKDAIIASLMKTPAYGAIEGEKQQQFIFTRNQAEAIENFKPIGFLPLGPEALKKAWLNYAELLNATIKPVYGFLNSYTNNVNSYFLGSAGKGETRQEHALQAISDAQNLRDATDSAVKAIEEKK